LSSLSEVKDAEVPTLTPKVTPVCHCAIGASIEDQFNKMNFILRLVQMGVSVGARSFAQTLVSSPAFHNLVKRTNKSDIPFTPTLLSFLLSLH